MHTNRITIKMKLIAGFGVMAVVVLIVSGLALRALNASDEGFSAYVHGINARDQVAAQIRQAVDRRAIAARNLVLATDPHQVELEKNDVTQAHQDVQAHLAKLNDMLAKSNTSTEQARSLVNDINNIEAKYGPVATAIVALALDNKRDEAIVKINTECRPLLAQLIKATDAYANYTHEREDQMVGDYASSFSMQRNILIVICLAAVALAMTAGMLITASITGPIQAAVTFARAVAKGDLSAHLEIKGRDETRDLLEALYDMNHHLTEVVNRVRSSSGTIGRSAGEIAVGNSDLSQRTEEQAASLQQTAASMEQLTSTVKQNTENAQQAKTLAGVASDAAQKSSTVVNEVVETMHDISENSKKIADITGIIEGIAFQTNILALNAAVEAARAGDQGRGFAVVAGEVRSLAQRSSSAAKEIKELIATSVGRVHDGSVQVGHAGASMAEVTQAVRRFADIMGEIASASLEQSHGIEQVNQAITQMDHVTQKNAVLVQGAAQASRALETQGLELTEAVAFFCVEPSARVVGAERERERERPQARPARIGLQDARA
jgi:methyl-accepting chemotaxis protein-1 (serine sensor receptor)